MTRLRKSKIYSAKTNGCDSFWSQPFFISASLRGAASDVAISYINHSNEIPTLILFARNDVLLVSLISKLQLLPIRINQYRLLAIDLASEDAF